MAACSDSLDKAPSAPNAYEACLKIANAAPAESGACVTQEYAAQTARLNLAYEELLVQSAPETQQQLQKDQRAWLKFRASNCRFFAVTGYDRKASINEEQCLLNVTASRAVELRQLIR